MKAKINENTQNEEMLSACCCATDIDECLTDICGDNSTVDSCTNSVGSYSCKCKNGYEDKNGTCVGLSDLLLPVTTC